MRIKDGYAGNSTRAAPGSLAFGTQILAHPDVLALVELSRGPTVPTGSSVRSFGAHARAGRSGLIDPYLLSSWCEMVPA